MSDLIPKHGGFRKLRSFQVAQQVYDGTVYFCNRFIDKRSRTHDQMVQAARSGVQNIVEGSLAAVTSKKMELKLTSVARASLGELLLDYEDYLRQRGMEQWTKDHPSTAFRKYVHTLESKSGTFGVTSQNVHSKSSTFGLQQRVNSFLHRPSCIIISETLY